MYIMAWRMERKLEVEWSRWVFGTNPNEDFFTITIRKRWNGLGKNGT
jgi:hypothetical protein